MHQVSYLATVLRAGPARRAIGYKVEGGIRRVLSRGRVKVVNILISYSDLADLLEEEPRRLSITTDQRRDCQLQGKNVRSLAIT